MSLQLGSLCVFRFHLHTYTIRFSGSRAAVAMFFLRKRPAAHPTSQIHRFFFSGVNDWLITSCYNNSKTTVATVDKARYTRHFITSRDEFTVLKINKLPKNFREVESKHHEMDKKDSNYFGTPNSCVNFFLYILPEYYVRTVHCTCNQRRSAFTYGRPPGYCTFQYKFFE